MGTQTNTVDVEIQNAQEAAEKAMQVMQRLEAEALEAEAVAAAAMADRSPDTTTQEMQLLEEMAAYAMAERKARLHTAQNEVVTAREKLAELLRIAHEREERQRREEEKEREQERDMLEKRKREEEMRREQERKARLHTAQNEVVTERERLTEQLRIADERESKMANEEMRREQERDEGGANTQEIATGTTIEPSSVEGINFKDLNFKIKCESVMSAINKDIFFRDYGGDNENIVTICFTYNHNLPVDININKFTLNFTTNNLFEGSILIVGGGGAGGYNIGGGGGGEVIYIDNITFKGNTDYNIVVGKGGTNGGRIGEHNYYTGDSGYNSGLNDILAKGGGGGGSYIYDTVYNLLSEGNSPTFASHDGKGLNGGSGGGGCGFQYNKDYKQTKVRGEKTSLHNPLAGFDNYYSFGSNGGIGIGYESITSHWGVLVRGGGGGGAGENGEDSGTDGNILNGKGGNGKAIEDIRINTGDFMFCPILNIQGIKCEDADVPDFVTGGTKKVMRSKMNSDNKYYYWGGGGGAGAFNAKGGNGGIGGGGGGGTYDINSSTTNPADAVSAGIHNTVLYFNADSTDSTDSLHNGKVSIETITMDNDKLNISKGGDGINNTGGGGGGGGLASNGGKGGSGIVILLLNKIEKEIIEKEPENSLLNIETVLSEFENNKKEFGKNISKMYNYNIKEHREFYDYMDALYEDELLIKNIPHDTIKNELENHRVDFTLLKYNYNKDIYNTKFHHYLKIIFDLKINYDSFLLYSKKRNENIFIPTDSLYDYQRLIIIIIDIIEDIMILIRNNKDYHELINNIDILQFDLLGRSRITYNGDNVSDYYTYREHNNTKIMTFYISDNNIFTVNNNIVQTESEGDDKIITAAHLENYGIDNIELKKLLQYNTVKECYTNYLLDKNDMNLFIKMYLYSLLKIKKHNFIKNILTIYIYIGIVHILQNFYKECEEFLLGDVVSNYTIDNELSLCSNKLYQNLQSFNLVVSKMKSLLGYTFISEYINDYKINIARVVDANCPLTTLELYPFDSEIIISMLYKKTETNHSTEAITIDSKVDAMKSKDYYKKDLKNSFLIEIEKNRYSINDIKFIKKNNRNIVELIIDDRYSKICKNKEQIQIKDIYIQAKDSTHINEIYDSDVKILDTYNKKIQTQKKDLDNINDMYGKYKHYFEILKYKNNIYYFLLFLILAIVIILNIANINSYMKTIVYLISLTILAILIIYNYFTKVNLKTIEKYENTDDNDIFRDYYKISRAEVTECTASGEASGEAYLITIKLSDEDSSKLKIRKFKNDDKNTDDYLNNLIKKDLRIYYIAPPDSGGSEDEFTTCIDVMGVPQYVLKNINDIVIDDSDIHYYYIKNIQFLHNKEISIPGELQNVGLVKNDETLIQKLIIDINNYETITTAHRNSLCNDLTNPDTERKEITEKKLIYVYTVRNDLLRYINNKFINVNKIIESIELENANNLSNKVHKSLTNEKKNLLHYQKDYDNKKLKNINVNNLYKHEILYQTAFINFILLFSMIVVLLLLLLNMFPSKIIYIMIIGFILISVNIYNYILNSLYSTRRDANKKYW